VVDVVERVVSVVVVVVEVGGKMDARVVEVVEVEGVVGVVGVGFWSWSVVEATSSLWVPVVWVMGGKVGRILLKVIVEPGCAVTGEGEAEVDEDEGEGEEALVTGMVT
jgi:hypothetical protein